MDTQSAPSFSAHASLPGPDEQKLLAMLEEQNRLLETDSKSLYPTNSDLQSTSPFKTFSLEDSSLSTWACIVTNWEDWSKRRVKQLKEMIRKGIPPQYRPEVWQMLCDAQKVAVGKLYSALLQEPCPSEKLIRDDLRRILPLSQIFQEVDRSKDSLVNVLKAYSVLDPECGYSKGSAFIVALLLMQMGEVETFGVFVRLMQDFMLRDLHRPCRIDLGCCLYQFNSLIEEQLPELHSHFQTQAFHSSMFSSSWFLTVFLSFLPLTAACRVFDIFMCEGLEIVYRVGLAILRLTQVELMQHDAEGMMQFLEKVAPQRADGDPDKMIVAAYQIKYDSKRMKQLEKEYTSIKIQKMENQETIKKLHVEKQALRCRIESLEKRFSEDLVWQMSQDLAESRLRNSKHQYVLKQMQIEILLMEKCSTVPDDSSVMDLQDQLLKTRLREEETLTGIRELRRHIKALEVKWKDEQKSGSGAGDVQTELMEVKLREMNTQLTLAQNRHSLLQLQTQNQICRNQLKRLTELTRMQTERLQELTVQNQSLRALLQSGAEEEEQKKEAGGFSPHPSRVGEKSSRLQNGDKNMDSVMDEQPTAARYT